jgi:hypothetical protein
MSNKNHVYKVYIHGWYPGFKEKNEGLHLGYFEEILKRTQIKNYVIENSVSGFITMKLTDNEFENSLKLVMRNSYPALTYTKENDVWIVKSRRIKIEAHPDPYFNSDPLPYKPSSFQIIRLNHIDPFDLQSVLGNIFFINQGTRQNGGMSGGRNF